MSRALPLTTIERVLRWDDTPSHPCHIFLRMRLSGALKRDEFSAALTATLRRHPLLRARLEHRDGTPCWIMRDDAPLPLTWIKGQADEGRYPSEAVPDLETDNGFHCVVRVWEGGGECFFAVHHACCDGRGMLQLAGDLFAAYATERGEGARWPGPVRREPELLNGRGRLARGARERLGLLWTLATGVPASLRFLLRRPSPLVVKTRPTSAPSGSDAAVSCFVDFELGETETRALQQSARAAGAMPNDLMLRDFFVTLARCRACWGETDPRAWLRVMVPFDLRTSAEARMPAASILSPVFLDRRDADMADPDRLLAGIARELETIKRRRWHLLFVAGFTLTRPFERLVEKIMRRPDCRLTASFTNLGRIPPRELPTGAKGRVEAGGVRVNAIHAAGANRPGQHLTLAVVAHEGRLCFTLHADLRALSRERGDEIVATFTARLRESIAAGAKPTVRPAAAAAG